MILRSVRMFEVIYTPQAEKQLRKAVFDIYDASKDYQTAVNYIEGIKNSLDEIKKNPKLASLTNYQKWRKQGVRKIHFRHYYAYFLIDEPVNVMRVIAVVYDGMDQETFLEKNVKCL